MAESNSWLTDRVNRRRFIVGSAFGTFGVIGAALIGCTTNNDNDKGSGTPTTSGPTTTRIVVAEIPPSAEGFLPHQHNASGAYLMRPAFETLVYQDPVTFEFQPMLAESWDISDDGTVFKFNIRKVPFHDGRGELTAEDVKFSIDLHMRKDNVSSVGQLNFKTLLKSVTVLDKQTLEIRTNGASPEMLSLLANTGEVFILSKAYADEVGLDAAGAKPIGTGPFKVVKWNRAESVEFEAVPKHWRVTPEYRELVIRFVGEESTRLSLVESGEVDIAPIPASQAQAMKAAGLTVSIGAWPERSYIAGFMGQYFPNLPEYNPSIPWVGDGPNPRKVREAMNLALDRKALRENVLFGAALPTLTFGSVAWSDRIRPSTWQEVRFDKDRARQLLAEAGLSNGFAFKISYRTSESTPLKAVAQALAAMWEAVGLRVSIEPRDPAVQQGLWRERKLAGEVFLLGTPPSNTPPDQASSFGRVLTGVQFAQYDDVSAEIERGRQLRTVDERWKAEIKAAEMLLGRWAYAPLFATLPVYAMNPKKVKDWSYQRRFFVDYLELIRVK